ncbi:hypothetical protein PLICRDRAFT_50314 [Plicaturopsis crispa FD-325 SS-3]|nr:hypothetical protein PLICRDRAFT_50314 [Plicaturopsis crispa FD-325 SS-3]
MSHAKDDIPIPPPLANLATLIEERPECLASRSKDIQAAALDATKFVFDLAVKSEAGSKAHIVDLISSLTPAEAPQTRSQARATSSGKRKRSPTPPPPPPKSIFKETPLTALFVEGMNADQVWEQLDLRAKSVCEMLEEALEGGPGKEDEDEDEDGEGADEEDELKKALQELREQMGEDVDFDGMDLDGLEEDGSDEEDEEEESENDGDDADLGETTMELRDPSDDEASEDADDHPPSMLDVLQKRRPPKRKAGGHPVLDDGFFDLAAFNAETERAEARAVSKGRLSKGSDDEDSDDEGTVDLFAPISMEEDFDEAGSEDGGEDPMYRDFFEPPQRNATKKAIAKPSPTITKRTSKVRFHEEVRVKNIKAKGKNLPLNAMEEDEEDEEDEEYDEEEDDGLEGLSMKELRQKMLEAEAMDEDEDEDGSEDEEGSEDDEGEGESGSDDDEPSDEEDDDGRDTIERLKDDLFAEEEAPEPDLSTHEKRMASLKEQISTLESENVGKKDWVLMGEATSRARPQNSLLEEDLEFERVMKAVPVITEEVVQGLEERIKARILEGQFDDVVRIRPLEDKPFLPSRVFELQDTKSAQSLSQIYEDEYSAAVSGGVAGEDRDGKLKKEHDEIEKLWDGICHKLDALCNAHYMPKQPKATISTISNVSAASLESALPTTKSASTMLAPEEVFAPSPSDTRSRSELTPAEKRALRGKERKARKKSRDALEKSVDKYAKKVRGIGGVKKQKQEALESVVKKGRGVTVVGKKNKDIVGKDRKRS